MRLFQRTLVSSAIALAFLEPLCDLPSMNTLVQVGFNGRPALPPRKRCPIAVIRITFFDPFE